MTSDEIVENVGRAVDLAGVAIIVCGAVAATAVFAHRALGHRHELPLVYRSYRQSLGRAILLGLEVLVAGDIIRTVAVSPTLDSVAVLAAIVGVRTFLSFSLEVELEGRWPWQARPETVREARPGGRPPADHGPAGRAGGTEGPSDR
ncbi:DUF1622 domain-containing protein [Actinomadura roseirufa]|uniref:DUF1622 domain-containing protein n=1 Tax=Actinomadura roseirufa TaxID=2094049 RepID=UPI001040FF78|nr:DUF1622 domain-containing protein [Actinomadura roseirufa]